METSSYRGRFAPSPTGPLHFGSLVAAVGSYLEAKSRGGGWLVRMEDLDPARSDARVADDILRTLEAFGLQWDENVVYQSARADAYRAAFAQLQSAGWIFPCACSRREIADSAMHGIDGPVYPGTCRNGLPPGKSARAFRVRVDSGEIAFDDRVQGRVTHDLAHQVGDFIVLRADGVFAYQLAVVVDDAAQGITDIVRGADLIDSTTRQIWLQQLLGGATPSYAHLPVALNPAGEKLSKQTLARPLDVGRASAQIHRALAFLNQAQPADAARMELEELWRWAIAHWRIEDVPRSRGIVFHE
jgi:glutamyl-Q tRNA(Asp) synthetase